MLHPRALRFPFRSLTPAGLLLLGLGASCRLESDKPAAGAGAPVFAGQAFVATPPRWVRVGQALEFAPALAEELRGAELGLGAGPQGMTLDVATGTLRWSPLLTQRGRNTVRLTATLAGRVYEQRFELTVVDVVPVGSMPLGVAGGTFQAGAVTVEVPAGALQGPATLEVGRYDGLDEPIDLPDAGFVGEFWDIELVDAGGDVVQPNGDLRLTFAYDEASLPPGAAESDLVVHVVDEAYEAWAVPADTSRVDTAANTVTVDTPHLSIWTLAVYYVPHFYTELATDGKVSVSYDDQLLFNVPAARAYCEEILATIQAAKVHAADLGLLIAEDVTVRVFAIDGGNGYYNPLTEVIYIDDSLDEYHLRSTPTHEYFHAVTHNYYSMGAEKLTQLNWWFEALGAWFATKAAPDALEESIRAAPQGYLRAHLEDRDKNNAYAKGTFIEFAEARIRDFVLTVFVQNSTFSSTLDAIDALLPLGTGYAEYVAWAVGRYGPGELRDLDAQLTLLSDGAVSYAEYYEPDGTPRASPDTLIVDPDPITGVAQLAFDGMSRTEPYRSFVYRARVDARTSGKEIVSRLSATPPGADRGWVLAMRGETLVSSSALAPDGISFESTRRLGTSADDAFDSVVFVYPDTSQDGGRTYRWELDVGNAPRAAQVELSVPPDRERATEFRVLPSGGFAVPTLEVDLGADPGTPEWGLVAWTYQSRPFELTAPSWLVFRVAPSSTSTFYGDPDLSVYNSANPASIGPTYAPPAGLEDVDFVRFDVFGCDGVLCSRRGEQRVYYLDGEVDFSFTADVSGFVPINGQQPATPVDLVATLRNGSSFPLVVNSVLAHVGRGVQDFETELRLPAGVPLVVVPGGETRTLRFDDVALEASSANWGTTQPVWLEIGDDNGSNLAFGGPDLWPALFLSGASSEPLSLTVHDPSRP